MTGVEVTPSMPEHDEVRLRLLGRSGHQDARAVHRAFGALLALVGRVQGPGQRLSLSKVGTGSTVLAVRPEGVSDDVLGPILLVTSGIAALDQRVGIPDGWDSRMIEDLIDIGRAVEAAGIEGAEIDWADHAPVRIDQRVRDHAEASLSTSSTSLGSIQGRIDRWVNRPTRQEAGLVDESTGRAVTINFQGAMAQEVFAALERRAVVWGEVRRNERGEKVSVLASQVVVLPERARISGTLQAIQGSLGDWTDGDDTVAWVRAQRDYSPVNYGS